MSADYINMNSIIEEDWMTVKLSGRIGMVRLVVQQVYIKEMEN